MCFQGETKQHGQVRAGGQPPPLSSSLTLTQSYGPGKLPWELLYIVTINVPVVCMALYVVCPPQIRFLSYNYLQWSMGREERPFPLAEVVGDYITQYYVSKKPRRQEKNGQQRGRGFTQQQPERAQQQDGYTHHRSDHTQQQQNRQPQQRPEHNQH